MSDFEGLPVAIVEAMALGVVPVARQISSGIPELVLPGLTGILVDANPETAAAALVGLAKNPSQLTALSKGARHHISTNYSHSSCVAKWIDLINECSAKCTVQYPIKIPKRVVLPRLLDGSINWDRRRPHLAKRVIRLPITAARFLRHMVRHRLSSKGFSE